jgi:hypothetical protein
VKTTYTNPPVYEFREAEADCSYGIALPKNNESQRLFQDYALFYNDFFVWSIVHIIFIYTLKAIFVAIGQKTASNTIIRG